MLPSASTHLPRTPFPQLMLKAARIKHSLPQYIILHSIVYDLDCMRTVYISYSICTDDALFSVMQCCLPCKAMTYRSTQAIVCLPIPRTKVRLELIVLLIPGEAGGGGRNLMEDRLIVTRGME